MLCSLLCICSRFRALDTSTVLELEETYHAMEFTPFVAQRLPARTFVLASAELAEVFGRLGHSVGEEVDLYPAEWLACSVKSEYKSMANSC